MGNNPPVGWYPGILPLGVLQRHCSWHSGRRKDTAKRNPMQLCLVWTEHSWNIGETWSNTEWFRTNELWFFPRSAVGPHHLRAKPHPHFMRSELIPAELPRPNWALQLDLSALGLEWHSMRNGRLPKFRSTSRLREGRNLTEKWMSQHWVYVPTPSLSFIKPRKQPKKKQGIYLFTVLPSNLRAFAIEPCLEAGRYRLLPGLP